MDGECLDGLDNRRQTAVLTVGQGKFCKESRGFVRGWRWYTASA